jgi:hypothetical protein
MYLTGGGSALVTNTIFASNTAAAIAVNTGSTATLDHNLYHNNPTNTTGTVSETNARSGNPQFVDSGATLPDLHLSAASPARDAGTPIPGLVTDYENNERPLGLTYDIGAYERVPLENVAFYSNTLSVVSEGGQAVVTHTLQNQGDVTDTFTIDYSNLLGWPAAFTPTLTYVTDLGPGQSLVITAVYTAPSDARGLINTVVITATATNSDCAHRNRPNRGQFAALGNRQNGHSGR